MASDAETNPGGSVEMVPVTDPNENAFTVSLPRGWKNQAYLIRIQGMHRSVVTTQSPDSGVFLWMGDPNLPSFTEPTPELYPGHPFANLNPMLQVQSFIPAESFFRHYLQQKHGHTSGFQITDIAPCPVLEQIIRSDAQKNGTSVWVTTVSISFTFTDQGRPLRGRLHGTTFSFGPVWVADVMGIVTGSDGDPMQYDNLLFPIRKSKRTNPQWQMQQDQLHAQQIQQNHQNSMAWIQNSAQQHQIRMDSIQAQGDAALNSWNAQQAANDGRHHSFMNSLTEQTTVGYGSTGNSSDSDASHERFTNYIKDENTVVSQSGETYQVENGQERYYKHKSNDTYIGTDNYTEREDLRSKFGVNPDDYEEVKVRQ